MILTYNNVCTSSGVDEFSKFSWSDGTNFTYNSFTHLYDQEAGPKCTDVAMYQRNTWDATPCRDLKNWVCKRSAAVGMLSIRKHNCEK